VEQQEQEQNQQQQQQQQQQASEQVPKSKMHGFRKTSIKLTRLYEDFQHYLKKEKKVVLLGYVTTLSQLRRFCSKWEFQ
jgi:predicted lysophospholipase L1 biosynthesis ABC-type transport system permease subunit